jgi:hypothetical protein
VVFPEHVSLRDQAKFSRLLKLDWTFLALLVIVWFVALPGWNVIVKGFRVDEGDFCLA